MMSNLGFLYRQGALLRQMHLDPCDLFMPCFPHFGRPKYNGLYKFVCRKYRKTTPSYRDAETRAEHVITVFYQAEELADQWDFEKTQRQALRCAALLHDLQKFKHRGIHHWTGAEYVLEHMEKLDILTDDLADVNWDLVAKAIELHKGPWLDELSELIENGISMIDYEFIVALRVADKLARPKKQKKAEIAYNEARELWWDMKGELIAPLF